MKKLFLMLLATVSLIACNNDKGDDTPPPLPSPDADQIVYADEIEKKDAVSFTAPQAWTATVSDITARATNNDVDWLQLSAYSGAAGKQSLSLSLMPNFTGASRKVEIKIVSGDVIITIIVEQKATTENNKAPQYKTVKRINDTYNGEADGYIEFTYDNQQRVTLCKVVHDKAYEELYTITYSASQIVMVITGTNRGEDGPLTITFTVDSKGKITNRKIDSQTANYTYDTENRLTQYPCDAASTDGSSHAIFSRNVWEGSNIKTTYVDDVDAVVSNYEYTDKLNNGLASIDLTGGYKGPEYTILKEGSFGKKGKNLIKKETGTYTRDWSYDFDKDGNLIRFSIACSVDGEQWTESHDIIYN